MKCSTQGSPVFTISQSLLRFTAIKSVMLTNHLIPLPLFLLPSIFPSIRVFSNDSALHIMWPKYWSFSISPSNEYSGFISFRIDWFDLPAVQETLKSLLQHHNLKASVSQHSSFFTAQLSQPYMTTGKTITLPDGPLSAKCYLGFLIRCLAWLQFLSTMTLEPKKIKYVTASTFSSSICHEVMGLDAMILAFWMLNFKPAFNSHLSLSSRGMG